jgi:CRP-like cAMP-binding protein
MKYEENILTHLLQLPLVGELPIESLHTIIRHGERLFHRKRSWIIRHQEINDLYFVLEGTAVRCKENPFQVVEINELLGAGMHFGDIFFSGGPQSIRAVSDCKVLRIDRKNLEMFIDDHQCGFLKQRLSIVSFLEDLQLLYGMNPSDRLHLAASLEIVQTDKEQVVIKQGDDAEHMYSILSGTFQVEKEGITLAELSHQDSFGEMGIFLQQPRTATVRSSGNGSLIKIPGHILDQIRQKNFHTEYAIERLTKRRMNCRMSR